MLLSWESRLRIQLCNIAEEIIISQPMILQAKPPLKIFGDIHGSMKMASRKTLRISTTFF